MFYFSFSPLSEFLVLSISPPILGLCLRLAAPCKCVSFSPLLASVSVLCQDVHTSDESDCDDDLDPKTGMEVLPHVNSVRR